MMQYSVLLVFEVFRQEEYPLGMKKLRCLHCYLAELFQSICIAIQDRVCIDTYFDYWIVSRVSVKKLHLQK